LIFSVDISLVSLFEIEPTEWVPVLYPDEKSILWQAERKRERERERERHTRAARLQSVPHTHKMVSEEKKIDEKNMMKMGDSNNNNHSNNNDNNDNNIQVILAQRRKEQLEASVKRSIPVVAPEDEVSVLFFVILCFVQ
jgi:hypothetical protein